MARKEALKSESLGTDFLSLMWTNVQILEAPLFLVCRVQL